MRNAKLKRAAAVGCGALVAALLSACVESGKEPEHLRGMAYNTCGPTDGPAVEIMIRKAGAGGCADTGAIEASIHVDGIQIDSLVAGESLPDSQAVCANGSCQPSVYYRLQIESADSKSAQGTLETREKETNGGETVKRVEVDLAKCPDIIERCG